MDCCFAFLSKLVADSPCVRNFLSKISLGHVSPMLSPQLLAVRPFDLIVFSAAADLSLCKLPPALLQPWRDKQIPLTSKITGRRLASRYPEIIALFKDVAHMLVNDQALQRTRMVIRLRLDEGVKLLLFTRDIGPGGIRFRYVPVDLSYAEHFEAYCLDACERLLMAIVRSDLALFLRGGEVEAAWKLGDGVFESWRANETPAYPYPAGSDRPTQAAMLLDRDGRELFHVA